MADNLRSVVGGRWLQRPERLAEPVGVGIDSREDLAGRVFIALRGQRHDGHDHLAEATARGAVVLIVECDPARGVVPRDVGVLRVESTHRALTRLATAYRDQLAATKVIAVTGSSGKTTTRRMIHHVLSRVLRGTEAPKSFNNHIGVPLTLLGARSSDRYVVAEIGTSAPGEIATLAAVARPDIAVITMIGQAHLEGLGSVEGVAREKATLLYHMREGGTPIVNADSPPLREHLRNLPSVILFGKSDDADLRLTGRGREGDLWWFEINHRNRFRLGLAGEHNAINAIAAVAVARRMGLTDELIDQGLATVKPVDMRMSRLRIGSIDVYNDAYNANPDSMQAALSAFVELTADAPRRVVILGDMLELGGDSARLHHELGEALANAPRLAAIDHAIFVGPQSKHGADAVRRAWGAGRMTEIARLNDESGTAIAALLRPRDAVLIKASRGSALEQVLASIEQRHGRTPSVEPASRPRPHDCPVA